MFCTESNPTILKIFIFWIKSNPTIYKMKMMSKSVTEWLTAVIARVAVRN